MKRKQQIFKGISIITLIFTIAVVVILLSVIVPVGKEKMKEAQITTFNNDITSIIGEVQSYMVMNNQEFPAKKDINGNYITYSINSNPALLAQVTKWNDQNDTFYILDTQKIKLDNKKIGNGATIDDYYIIAAKSGNIYYAKGVKIDGSIYYTKTDTSI